MFYIYMIDDLYHKKRYIGQRKCPINCAPEIDKYMGSGVALKKAMSEFDKKYFKKTIICECESQEIANELETYFIEKHNAVSDDNFYNLTSGPIKKNALAVAKKAKEAESSNVICDFLYRYDYDWPDPQCFEFYRDLLKTETEAEPAIKKVNYIKRTFKANFGHTFLDSLFYTQLKRMRANAPKITKIQSDHEWFAEALMTLR